MNLAFVLSGKLLLERFDQSVQYIYTLLKITTVIAGLINCCVILSVFTMFRMLWILFCYLIDSFCLERKVAYLAEIMSYIVAVFSTKKILIHYLI